MFKGNKTGRLAEIVNCIGFQFPSALQNDESYGQCYRCLRPRKNYYSDRN